MKITVNKSQKTTAITGCSERKVEIMRFVGMVLIAAIILTAPVFASANYGEEGGKWILEQMSWVGMVVVAVAAIKFYLAGNYVKLLITVVVGGLVLMFIDAPEHLKNMATNIWSTVTTGA